MLYMNVGLFNGVIGVINVYCDYIFMFLMFGCILVMEKDCFGVCIVLIGWG